MLKTCQIAVSKPNIETACGASEVSDSSFEAQQKQLVGPREDPWQSSERPSKAAGRVLRLLRVLKRCQIAVSKPNIETACGASEVPDSSFEAQQKQLVGPREDPWQSSERPSKAATCQIAVSKPNRNSLSRLGSAR